MERYKKTSICWKQDIATDKNICNLCPVRWKSATFIFWATEHLSCMKSWTALSLEKKCFHLYRLSLSKINASNIFIQTQLGTDIASHGAVVSFKWMSTYLLLHFAMSSNRSFHRGRPIKSLEFKAWYFSPIIFCKKQKTPFCLICKLPHITQGSHFCYWLTCQSAEV